PFPERGLRALCMPYLGGTSLERLLAEVAPIEPAARRGRDLLEALDRNQARFPTPSLIEGPCRRLLEGTTWVQAVCWITACLADALDGPSPTAGRPTHSAPWIPRNPEVGAGLSALVRRCLAPEPSSRYEDAATLADDLRRHLNDLPLRGVKNLSLVERWSKWRRRRP